ncbi:MAG: ribonuclease HIII [Parachlamydia sp.]|jgi:ribonuclease HIII|nr:ribonuclease HIII [Parachlamydia sp.]
MSSKSPFVTTLDSQLADKLLSDLTEQGFAITNPPHTRFSANKEGIACTLYLSGKLVIQGKESAAFIEFYLEPEILKTFQFSHPLVTKNTAPHIGIDESGKGDFFGPLCIAGVYVDQQFDELLKLGIKDSKVINDKSIYQLAPKIKERCLWHVVRINPPKYNEIYANFKNLNRLLAWGHATVIEHLVLKSGCKDVIVDQFANPSVVELALKRKKIALNLTQQHRAEEDIAVAAASILARHAFLEGLRQLGEEIGITLPKGSSSLTQTVGRQIIEKRGKEQLLLLCKQHFKTLDAILGKKRE